MKPPLRAVRAGEAGGVGPWGRRSIRRGSIPACHERRRGRDPASRERRDSGTRMTAEFTATARRVGIGSAIAVVTLEAASPLQDAESRRARLHGHAGRGDPHAATEHRHRRLCPRIPGRRGVAGGFVLPDVPAHRRCRLAANPASSPDDAGHGGYTTRDRSATVWERSDRFSAVKSVI